MMKHLKILRGIAALGCLSTTLLFAVGCKSENKDIHKETPTGKKAVAVLSPTKGSDVKGKIEFIQLTDGIRIIGDVTGLKPGEHGFHIHEFGDCSAPDASSAGGHYDPEHVRHGGPLDLPRHVGDLGNIVADESGNAYYEAVNHLMRMDGSESIIGHSVIVHEDRDDYVSQPTGNAGPRLACGVIIEEGATDLD